MTIRARAVLVTLIWALAPAFGQDAADHTRVFWRNIGMGGGGAFYHVTADPNDGDTLFVGIDMNGLYKTEDGAESWQNLSNLEMRSDVSACIAVAPGDGSIVYNGAKGIQKSTDGGHTWETVCDIGGNWVMDRGPRMWASGTPMVIDPDDSDTVWFGTPGGNLRRTTDGGESWEIVTDFTPDDDGTAGQFDEGVQSILIDPTSPVGGRTVFVATWEGMFRSTDGGASWEAINEGLPHTRLMAVAGGAKDGELRLYALLHPRMIDGRYAGGVYRSYDGGDTWVERNDGLCTWVQGGVEPEEIARYSPKRAKHATRYYNMRVFHGDPDVVYLYADGVVDQWATRGLYRSDDGCESWRFIEVETLGRNWNECYWDGRFGLAISATDPDVLYSCQGMNVFKSVDGGHGFFQVMSDPVGDGSWRTRGLDNDLWYKAVPDPRNPGTVYFTDADAGLVYTRDGGETWFAERRLPNDAYALALDPVAGAVAVGIGVDAAKRAYGGLAISRDGCQTWERVERNPESGLPASNVIAIAVDDASPANARTWYASSMGHGVRRSDDAGRTWRQVNAGLPQFDPDDRGGGLNVRELTVAARDTVYAIVGTVERGGGGESEIYRTTDGGASWEALDTEAIAGRIYELLVRPEDPAHLICGAGRGVYESADGGRSWTQILSAEMLSGPIATRPHFDATAMCVEMPPDDAQVIFAGLRRGGAVMTEDGGASWHFVCDGLGHRAVEDLALDPSDASVIWACTRGQSGYRGTIVAPGEEPPAHRPQARLPAPDPARLREEFERMKAEAGAECIDVPRAEPPITIASWVRAAEVRDFRHAGSGEPYLAPTRARLLHDGTALHIRMDCSIHEGDLGAPARFLGAGLTAPGRRDASLWGEDSVEVLLATDGDATELCHFIANARGARWDGLHHRAGVDAGWDGRWEASGEVSGATLRHRLSIPLALLPGGAPVPGDTLRIKLCRNDFATRSFASWPASPQGFACRPRYWAELRLL